MKFLNKFYYQLSNSNTRYGRSEPGTPDFARFINGHDDWYRKDGVVVKQKSLILADWSAQQWHELKNLHVQSRLIDLLNEKEPFKLYLWQDGQVVPLNDPTCLSGKSVLDKITPVDNNTLIARAVEQHRSLSRQSICVLDDHCINLLLGRSPDSPRIVDVHHLLGTSHKQADVVAVLKVAEPAVTAAGITSFYSKQFPIKNIPEQLQYLWPELPIIEAYESLDITYDADIERSGDDLFFITPQKERRLLPQHIKYIHFFSNNPYPHSKNFYPSLWMELFQYTAKHLCGVHFDKRVAFTIVDPLIPRLKQVAVIIGNYKEYYKEQKKVMSNLLKASRHCRVFVGDFPLTSIKHHQFNILRARNGVKLQELATQTGIRSLDVPGFPTEKEVNKPILLISPIPSDLINTLKQLFNCSISALMTTKTAGISFLNALTQCRTLSMEFPQLGLLLEYNSNDEIVYAPDDDAIFNLPMLEQLTLQRSHHSYSIADEHWSYRMFHSLLKGTPKLKTLHLEWMPKKTMPDDFFMPQVEQLTLPPGANVRLLRSFPNIQSLSFVLDQSFAQDNALLLNDTIEHLEIRWDYDLPYPMLANYLNLPRLDSCVLDWHDPDARYMRLDKLLPFLQDKQLKIEVLVIRNCMMKLAYLQAFLNHLPHLRSLVFENSTLTRMDEDDVTNVNIKLQAPFDNIEDIILQKYLPEEKRSAVITPQRLESNDHEFYASSEQVAGRRQNLLSASVTASGGSKPRPSGSGNPATNRRVLASSDKTITTAFLPSNCNPAQPQVLATHLAFEDSNPLPVQRIFYAKQASQHPKPETYRLSSYDTITITEQTITYRNKAIEITPIELLSNDTCSLSDVSNDPYCYYGVQVLRVNPQEWTPIASLSPQDAILRYRIDAPAQAMDIEWGYSDAHNQYFIRSRRQTVSVTLHFIIKSMPVTASFVDNNLKRMIKHFSETPLKALESENTGLAYLNDVITQAAGACGDRAIAFKMLVETPSLLKTHFGDIKLPAVQVRLVENACHLFIEINESGQWIACELGGYSRDLNIQEAIVQNGKKTAPITLTKLRSVSEKQRGFETYFQNLRATPPIKPSLNLKQYIANLFKHDKKKHLLLLSPAQIQGMNIAIQQEAINLHRRVFYAHKAEDLTITTRFMRRLEDGTIEYGMSPDGAGLWHTFLTKAKPENEPTPIVIVNFSTFSDEEIVQQNEVFSENMIVIALIDNNRPGRSAIDFSRYHQEDCANLTIPSINPVFIPNPSSNAMTITINLCHSSNWLAKLTGEVYFRHGTPFHEQTPFLDALKNQAPIICINNPPQDSEFELFWQQARLHRAITVLGKRIDFPDNIQLLSINGYDWQDVLNRITWTDDFPAQARILNPSTRERFRFQYGFDEQAQLHRFPGWLAQHSKEKPDEALPLYITRTLHDDEWGLFFIALAEHPDLQVMMARAPGVILPESFDIPQDTNELIMSDWQDNDLCRNNTSVVMTSDPYLFVCDLKQKHADDFWTVLDASGCTTADLLQYIKPEMTAQGFSASRKTQALLTLLSNKQNVMLVGTLSEELLDCLAVERLESDAPGHLLIVTSQTISFFPSFQYTAFIETKREILLKQGYEVRNVDAVLNTYTAEPFPKLCSRLQVLQELSEKDSEWAWDGLYSMASIQDLAPFDFARSSENAAQFMEKRHQALTERLGSKLIVLTGPTGSGKTQFVKRELPKNKRYHVFSGEGKKNRLAWAKARGRDDELFFLFIDEVNLVADDLQQLSSMMENTPPGILVETEDGQCYYQEITLQHRIIAACNPLSDGAERSFSAFLENYAHCLFFQPLSLAFIYETSIRPIFEQGLLSDTQKALATQTLFAVYVYVTKLSRNEILISPRQVEMIASLIVHAYQRNHTIDLEATARFYAAHIAKSVVPSRELAAFERTFPTISPILDLPDIPRYHHVPSRDVVLLQLLDYLAIRKQQRDTIRPDKKYQVCGLNCLILEGEPGIAKTLVLLELLSSLGFQQGRLSDSVMNEHRQVFYRLAANTKSEERAEIYKRAFIEGSIVLVDEINSMPEDERFVMGLLDGVDIKALASGEQSWPNRAGFRILGTQNPITMAGRRQVSAALRNRTQVIYVKPYQRNEFISVATHIGLDINDATQLIDAYLHVSQTSSSLTVRDCLDYGRVLVNAQQNLLAQNIGCRARDHAPLIDPSFTEKARQHDIWSFRFRVVAMVVSTVIAITAFVCAMIALSAVTFGAAGLALAVGGALLLKTPLLLGVVSTAATAVSASYPAYHFFKRAVELEPGFSVTSNTLIPNSSP